MVAQPEIKHAVNVFDTEKNGIPYIQFDFMGHLDAMGAQKAIAQWKGRMKNGVRNNLIYNCTEMTGFDTEARRSWQSTMISLKGQIGSIWIISSNVLILGAAKTMGLLTGFAIKVATSPDKIKD